MYTYPKSGVGISVFIPMRFEVRQYGVLHQAAFHGDIEVLRQLLEDYKANVKLLTKAELEVWCNVGTSMDHDTIHYDNYDISTAQDPTIVFSCAVRFLLFPRYEKVSKRLDQFAKSIKEPK